jgi:hypothetical protein
MFEKSRQLKKEVFDTIQTGRVINKRIIDNTFGGTR